MEGARQEGALGFFKGIGKGLLGVVVRPSVGIIDSGIFNETFRIFCGYSVMFIMQ